MLQTKSQIETNELKKLQLEILKYVHKFCTQNNLNYSLAYGTLIGAARHKGYIPWDDDIDIMMPRLDYDIFIKTFNHPIYKVYSAPETKGYILTFAKVVDTRTDLVEFSAQKLHLGVNIDIFPIDKLPDNSDELLEWNKNKIRLNKIYRAKLIPFTFKHPKLSLYRLYHEIKYPMLSLKKLGELIQNEAERFKNRSSFIYGMVSSPRSDIKHVYPKSILDEYVEIEFEGYKFKCIKDYDKFLTINFGNWREFPPEEKRVSHHLFRAYWL